MLQEKVSVEQCLFIIGKQQYQIDMLVHQLGVLQQQLQATTKKEEVVKSGNTS